MQVAEGFANGFVLEKRTHFEGVYGRYSTKGEVFGVTAGRTGLGFDGRAVER